MTKKTRAYDVYLNNQLIDTVFFTSTRRGRHSKFENEDEVRRSLVNHDGYDSDIIVKQVVANG